MTHRNRSRRSGVILIVALAALAILAGLATVNIRFLLSHRQAVKTERDLIQARLLCDAGCDRAVSMFAEDPQYTGEVWLDDVDPYSSHRMKVEIQTFVRNGQTLASIQASIDGRSHLPNRIQRTRHIALSTSQQP